MNKYLSRYFFYYPATLLKGEKIYRLLKKKRLNQTLSRQDLLNTQIRLANKVIQYANKNSQFYKQHFKDYNLEKIENIDDLSRLPTISKSTILKDSKYMTTSYIGSYETKTTGGSTGEPVTILKNTSALAHERAATWRSYEWAGISVGDPQGRFWGIPHTTKDRFKARVVDLIANRKRVNAFNLTNESMLQYYHELKRFRPRYLYGYVSVIEALAIFMRENNLDPISTVRAIITTSEVLYEHSRILIQEAFNVKVFNEYGCGEVGSIAQECEKGNMHIMADNLIVETSAEGELIVTDLHNYKMPLIRYKLGDFGKISNKECSCGRTLPLLENIHGRAYDFIHAIDGKRIHPESFIYVFETFKVKYNIISQFQVVQNKISNIDLFIIPKEGWSDDKAQILNDMMTKATSNNFKFNIIKVKYLGREKSGKMRLVKSQLN